MLSRSFRVDCVNFHPNYYIYYNEVNIKMRTSLSYAGIQVMLQHVGVHSRAHPQLLSCVQASRCHLQVSAAVFSVGVNHIFRLFFSANLVRLQCVSSSSL